jgi:hypothetical protein
MLRFLIGFTLLLLAVTLPLYALARGEPLSASSPPDLWPQLDQLLHPREPTDEEKQHRHQEEEDRKRLQQNALSLERMLAEKRASLANVGPTFEFSMVDGWLSPMGPYLRAACLIGATGKIYTYDVRKDAAAQTAGFVDEREFSQAVDLARSVGHVEWRPRAVTTDIGVVAWSMSLDGRRIWLQVAGVHVGAHPDIRVGELVKLIDSWCPYVQESRSWLARLHAEGIIPLPPY